MALQISEFPGVGSLAGNMVPVCERPPTDAMNPLPSGTIPRRAWRTIAGQPCIIEVRETSTVVH